MKSKIEINISVIDDGPDADLLRQGVGVLAPVGHCLLQCHSHASVISITFLQHQICASNAPIPQSSNHFLRSSSQICTSYA